MPSAKSGTEVQADLPEDAVDADDVTPGEVEEGGKDKKSKSGSQYSSTKVNPSNSSSENQQQEEDHFVEIELKDADGNPVPKEPYKVKLPDGKISSGKLGEDGKARIEGVSPGECEVIFPRIQKDELEQK